MFQLTKRLIEGRVIGQTQEMTSWTEGQIDRQMDGRWTDVTKDRQTDRVMGRLTDESEDQWTA